MKARHIYQKSRSRDGRQWAFHWPRPAGTSLFSCVLMLSGNIYWTVSLPGVCREKDKSERYRKRVRDVERP